MNVRDRSILFSIGALYITQGIPVYFFTLGLPTILRNEGLGLEWVGYLSFLAIPWAFKFLWAPLVDRNYWEPLGARTSWILPLQIVTAILLLMMSFAHPAGGVAAIFFIGLVLSFASSTQDIAIDAFAVENLHDETRTWGNTLQGAGAAAGSVLGGSLVLVLYDYWSWQSALQVLSLMAFIGALPFLLSRAEKGSHFVRDPHHKASVLKFLKRREVWPLLLLCLVYRLCEGLVMGMQQPFLIDKGLSPSEIGIVLGTAGAAVGLLASVGSGFANRRFGLKSCLVAFGLMRTMVYLLFSFSAAGLFLVSSSGMIAIVLMNMTTRYLVFVPLYTAYMEACSRKQAGTDFSIFVCADLLIYFIAAGFSGLLAKNLGYANHFALSAILSLLSVVVVLVVFHRQRRQSPVWPKLSQELSEARGQ